MADLLMQRLPVSALELGLAMDLLLLLATGSVSALELGLAMDLLLLATGSERGLAMPIPRTSNTIHRAKRM
jgi:hypothetical protein